MGGSRARSVADSTPARFEPGLRPVITMVPPAFSIFFLADSLMLSTSRWNFFFTSPRPRILMPSSEPRTSPAPRSELFIDGRAVVEALLEIVEVDDAVDGLERGVVEAALRHAAVQGHLTAFESETDASAGAGLLTLVALAGGLAVAAAFAAAETLDAVLGTGTGFEIVQSHSAYSAAGGWGFDRDRLAADLEDFVFRAKRRKGVQTWP